MAREVCIAIDHGLTHSQRRDGAALSVLAKALSDPHAVDQKYAFIACRNMGCRFDLHHDEPYKLQSGSQSEFPIVLPSARVFVPLPRISRMSITETAVVPASNGNVEGSHLDVDCIQWRD
jgi:hypothetical protein